VHAARALGRPAPADAAGRRCPPASSAPAARLMTGTTRAASASAPTRAAPGRVDWPPMSRMSAPAAASARPAASALAADVMRPPSLKLSGVTFSTPITCVRPCAAAARAAHRARKGVRSPPGALAHARHAPSAHTSCGSYLPFDAWWVNTHSVSDLQAPSLVPSGVPPRKHIGTSQQHLHDSMAAQLMTLSGITCHGQERPSASGSTQRRSAPPRLASPPAAAHARRAARSSRASPPQPGSRASASLARSASGACAAPTRARLAAIG